MSQTTTWSFPTEVRFGAGAVAEVGGVLAACAVSRALVVTDAGVAAAGLVEPLRRSLEAAGVDGVVYDGVQANPTEAVVQAGLDAYRAADAEAVVGLGGGSPMDTAKLVALAVNHPRPLADYDDARGGDRLVTEAVPPIVAVPTTAGTGSEVGRSAVVTLASSGRKTVIFSPKLLPALAAVDPALTVGLPSKLTAATGFDALTHCVEARLARGDHPMCDAIALGGARLAAGALERAVEQGDDLPARGDMMKAALMGAVAFQKGLGVCHSLAHPLSAVCGLPHGLANALCLPEAVRFDAGAAAAHPALDELGKALGVSGGPEALVATLQALRDRVGLPGSLAEAGVAEDDLAQLADEALADACHTLGPRPCTRADMLALYRACWS